MMAQQSLLAQVNELITCFFMLVGALFSLIAALGIFRMPDLFTRMQAAAKTSTLGVGCTILSVAIYFSDLGVTTRAVLVILFLYLTTPIAAHMIARAGYISGVRMWKNSVADEMHGRYDLATHELSSDHADDSRTDDD